MEVILSLALLSAMLLPLTLMVNQTAQTSKLAAFQSSRGLFLSEATAQMDANRGDYYQQFNDSGMNTSLTDSGQTIPYMTVIDTSKSNTFTRAGNLYAFSKTTDAVSAPRYQLPLFQTSNVFRMRCGNTANLMDSSGQEWNGDMAYDGTKKQPGYYTGVTTTTSSNTAQNILNVSSADYSLFQYWREGSTVDYRFDVPNGNYTVKLYFSEMTSGINSTNNRRLSNINLESTLMNATAYSPYETVGNQLYMGNIQSYDVTVTDGVLNLSLVKNASSANNPRLSGILIKKRLIEI